MRAPRVLSVRLHWPAATEAEQLLTPSLTVTVPVGVLQSDAFTIDPPLPEPVAGALSRLTMNAFEKVFLRFDEAFWDEGVYAIRQQGPESVWWHSWYDLTPLHDSPTLLTFAAGPAAVAPPQLPPAVIRWAAASKSPSARMGCPP